MLLLVEVEPVPTPVAGFLVVDDCVVEVESSTVPDPILVESVVPVADESIVPVERVGVTVVPVDEDEGVLPEVELSSIDPELVVVPIVSVVEVPYVVPVEPAPPVGTFPLVVVSYELVPLVVPADEPVPLAKLSVEPTVATNKVKNTNFMLFSWIKIINKKIASEIIKASYFLYLINFLKSKVCFVQSC